MTIARTAANNLTGPLTGTSGSGVTWASDPARGPVAAFDGTSGSVTTAQSAVNTGAGFTVSAWANLKSSGGNQTVMSQDGSAMSAFYLQYNSVSVNGPSWAFNIPTGDVVTPDWNAVYSPAATGQWTHLAGVYDSAAKTMKLYVNSALTGTLANVTTWASNGPLAIGRGLYQGGPADYFNGKVSDVRTYDQPLSDSQILTVTENSPSSPE